MNETEYSITICPKERALREPEVSELEYSVTISLKEREREPL